MVARAKTGSGKTFAYVLPLLHKLFSDSGLKNKLAPAAFVLVPTRELCQQVRLIHIQFDFPNFLCVCLSAVFGLLDISLKGMVILLEL